MKKCHAVITIGTNLQAKCINDNDVPETVDLVDVRAAVIQPTGSVPGYVLFLGSSALPNEYGKRAVLFLKEQQQTSIFDLINTTISLCGQYRCRTVYADRGSLTGALDGFYAALWNRISELNIDLSLAPATSVKDEDYGVVLIQEQFKHEGFNVPKYISTLLKVDLSNLTADVEKDQMAAFHACRYILAGWAIDPPERVYKPIGSEGPKSIGAFT